MHSLRGPLFAALMLIGCNPSFADSTIDYNVGSGWTSNIFQDPTALFASFDEAKLGLRGSLDLEESHFAYGLTTSVRHVPDYRFADRRTAGLEIGYAYDLSKSTKLTLKGGLEYRRSGDIFLSLPGLLIGYRKADIAAATSIGLTDERWGGKNHITAAVSSLNRGKAHFTLRGLRPTQLEAGNKLYEVNGGHIRPLLGGEVGMTAQYRTNRIDRWEQKAFGQFPAETLRGSLAYGRAFKNGITVMAEAGVVGVFSPHLGKTVEQARPFLKGELAWQASKKTVLKAKLTRDIQLADIDDSLAEDVRTVGLSLEKTLTERLKFGLAFEQAYSDWLYFDYRTRTKSLTATFTYSLAKGATAALEYSRLIRRENDKAADFKVDGLAARLSGSF